MLEFKPLTEENIKNFKVDSEDQEDALTLNLLAQIRTWLSEKKYPVNEVNTLLINKLLYFIIKELQQKNPHIKVSGGWFRYGPCLEEYRKRGEEGTQDLTLVQPTRYKQILEAVKIVCEEQVPLFFKCLKEDKSKRYFYHYLKYIYTDKCEYPDLKEYYIAKNELAYAFIQFAYTKEKLPNLKKSFVDFQSAIVNKKYVNFVKISTNTQEVIDNYLVIMKKLVQLSSHSKLSKSDEFWFVTRKIAQDFEKSVLGEFSYKNYIVTYKDINRNKESKRKKYFQEEVEKFETYVHGQINSNIELVNMLIGGAENA
jgi:hypothetical protein